MNNKINEIELPGSSIMGSIVTELLNGNLIYDTVHSEEMREWYQVIDSPEYGEAIFLFFESINKELEKGEGYYRLNDPDLKLDKNGRESYLRNFIHIRTAFRLMQLGNGGMYPGYRFNKSNLIANCESEAESEAFKVVETELNSRATKKDITVERTVEIALRYLKEGRYIELINVKTGEYEVTVCVKGIKRELELMMELEETGGVI